MSGQGAAQKARNMWRSLTSMGTALVLLFLLALAAIPGALLPQRGLNAAKVDDYLAAHPLIGPWLDELQAFDVFSSFWFTAIYVLLFVSPVTGHGATRGCGGSCVTRSPRRGVSLTWISLPE